MDEKLNSYFESLMLSVLESPNYSNFSEEQKDQLADKIRDHLYNTFFDTTIDNLTTEQLKDLKNYNIESEEFAEKLEEYSSLTPFLGQKIEKRLNEEVGKLRENPQLLQ